MEFPPGTNDGCVVNPQADGLFKHLMTFCGAIEVQSGTGQGAIVTDHGRLIAAYYEDESSFLRGQDALVRITCETEQNTCTDSSFTLKRYTRDDMDKAIRVARRENLLIEEAKPGVTTMARRMENTPRLLNEDSLKKISSQPGVISVSVFYEGFPIQSSGDADFEHVAVLAEDLMRAGTKIAGEMNIGRPDQLILETADNKLIIAPCGDLFLCVFSTADAHLGLIRVLIKKIQSEIAG
jgi:predicted regulator of Ras-like GTPase activity (Roadblock/LC7/MglB family)